MDDNQRSCLGFSLCGGFGPVTFKKLVKYYASPSKAFNAPESQLLRLIRESQVRRLVVFRKNYIAEKEIDKLKSKNIWVLACTAKNYPKQLLELYDPPICLFGKGDVLLFDFLKDIFVGIVGTRKVTSYGEQTAKWISRVLASQNIVIISGMATGVDSLAHKAALEAEGRTIAVLGTPIDAVYPRENVDLYNRIITSYGIVVSEYPPGYPINQGTFVARNRIIAALSQKLVVVEGGIQSGALITAKCAGELGREVYAVPGPITSDSSKGPNSLIQEGAHVLTHPTILMSEKQQLTAVKKENKPSLLTDAEEKLFTFLSSESLFSDELAQKVNAPISDMLPTLSLLEVRGVIKKNVDGSFTAQV